MTDQEPMRQPHPPILDGPVIWARDWLQEGPARLPSGKMRDKPWKTTAKESGGIVQAAHPWVEGCVLRFGVARMKNQSERDEFTRQFNRLLEAAPRERSDAPVGIPTKILLAYFSRITRPPLRMEDVDASLRKAAERYEKAGWKSGTTPLELAEIKLTETRTALNDAEAMIEELQRENRSLQAQVDGLLRTTGERSEAERQTTIKESFEWFKANIRMRPSAGKDSEEKGHIMRRLSALMDHLKWDTYLADITEKMILDANDKAGGSEGEKTKRLSDIRRMYKSLCVPVASGGFGAVSNPMALVKITSTRTLAKRRRQDGKQSAEGNPEHILAKLSGQWRVMYAVLAYAGLRPIEMANLRWKDFDAKKGILHIRVSEDYPEMKNEISPRAMMPFPDLWKIFAELKDNGKPWPFAKANGRHWIDKRGGKPRLNSLTSEIGQRCKWAGIEGGSIARRARRYWESRMVAEGHGDLIETWGGHSRRTGEDHYRDSLVITNKVTWPKPD